MIFPLILSYILIIIDQLSKFAVTHFKPNDVTVIPGLLKFDLQYNQGAAFSILDNNTLFLAIISTVASVVLFYFIFTKASMKTKKLFSISLALMLAGAFGNLIDRYLTVAGVLEGVVDFIDVYLFGWHFPGTFNLADSFLCVGVALLVIDILFLESRRNKINNEGAGDIEKTED